MTQPVPPPTRDGVRRSIADELLGALDALVARHRALALHDDHIELHAELIAAEVAHQLAMTRNALRRNRRCGAPASGGPFPWARAAWPPRPRPGPVRGQRIRKATFLQRHCMNVAFLQRPPVQAADDARPAAGRLRSSARATASL
jgi:hypothetical protein